eukprot:COSAG02_NODE_4541_length_5234_cov_4.080818_2_plen_77_part_00
MATLGRRICDIVFHEWCYSTAAVKPLSIGKSANGGAPQLGGQMSVFSLWHKYQPKSRFSRWTRFVSSRKWKGNKCH